MPPSTHPTLVCSNCGNAVGKSDPFCHRCGGLFDQSLHCVNHEDEEAEGVCVVCEKPLCGECGRWVDDVFLCEIHEKQQDESYLA